MPLLSVSAIHKQLSPSFALQDIHFIQQKHQKLSITGETGSGKSTLLKIIAGLVQPGSGTVLFNNTSVEGPDEQLVPGHPGIAYLSQDHELRNNYRIEELLEMANKLPAGEADKLYKLCRIDLLFKRKNGQLSGGEKQRIALARLLVGAPELLLLDEPFSNLDLIHKNILKSVIEDIGRQLQITCILTSHDPLDTLSWADEIIVMQAGRILQQGHPSIVYTRPLNEYVAGLFGQYMLLSPEQAAVFGCEITGKQKLFVRPEDFILIQDGPGISGQITRLVFRGAYQEVYIAVPSTVLQLITLDRGLALGDLVTVGLLPGRGYLMPDPC